MAVSHPKQLIEDIDEMLLADSFSNPSEKVKKGNMKKKKTEHVGKV
jgi:Arc/MetJ-type ribon-helix-helix transcriptional regulator